MEATEIILVPCFSQNDLPIGLFNAVNDHAIISAFVWPEYPRVISRRHENPSLNSYPVCGADFFYCAQFCFLLFFSKSSLPSLCRDSPTGNSCSFLPSISPYSSRCFHCSYNVTSDARLQSSFFPIGVLEHLLPFTRLSIHSFLGRSNFYFKATKILGPKSLQSRRVIRPGMNHGGTEQPGRGSAWEESTP